VPGIEHGGTLHVRGPNLMLGYLRHDNPGVLAPPSSSVGEGWYDTGDVVEIDEAGFVQITARLKRFAKVAGEMVSLEVVERIAAAASPNTTSAASTKTSTARGEMIVLFSQDRNLRRQHLVAAAKRMGLPELAVARRIEHIEKLPLLGSGKCDYVKLKTMAAELP
jgi:acyl-[acyl-carrier-protein]-phospholipid O-acyltransferase/long-chain-fatty-acid--[acyl-carrier-protein] ligase